VFVQQQVEKLAMTAIEFPADAKGREFQSRCCESENRGSPGGDSEGRRAIGFD